jgi:signal transduction histidine kinase
VQATAQVLKLLFAESRRVADARGLIEQAVVHLAALPGVTRVAILIQGTQSPFPVRASAAHGLGSAAIEMLGAHAPRGDGQVAASWPAQLLPALPGDLRFCAVPLSASREQVTLLCDGLVNAETVTLVATFLALALEREQAITDTQRLSELFNAGPVVVFRWRNAPGWPMEYVSPNVTRELGFPVEQLLEQPYAPLVHPGDLERIAAEVSQSVERGVSYFSQQYRLFDAQGQARDVFDFTHVIADAGGRVTHFHGYVFDDGARARAERARAELTGQLQQSQKLQAVGTLANGIAHDFNNVLAAILAHLELARLEAALTDNADLIAATPAAMRGRDIVRQLLVFGRPGPEERRPHRLQRIIEDSMGLMRSAIPGTIGLRLALDAKAPQVLVDATQMQQVLVNLVTNAAQAMPRGGTVDIALTSRSGTTSLSVTDSGEGMTPEVLERALEPFFTTRPVGSAGLGLSMVHSIVTAHGGSVRIESRPGVGTEVVVSLPALEAVKTPAVEEAVIAPGVPRRIALVDDEPLVARATERLLAHFGYEVTLLSSGAEVLRGLDANPAAFELVLTDQTMPEMTGLELTRALRAKGLRVPVLLVTGLPTEIDVSSITPPFRVLGKPYRSEELLSALSALLR